MFEAPQTHDRDQTVAGLEWSRNRSRIKAGIEIESGSRSKSFLVAIEKVCFRASMDSKYSPKGFIKMIILKYQNKECWKRKEM